MLQIAVDIDILEPADILIDRNVLYPAYRSEQKSELRAKLFVSCEYIDDSASLLQVTQRIRRVPQQIVEIFVSDRRLAVVQQILDAVHIEVVPCDVIDRAAAPVPVPAII